MRIIEAMFSGPVYTREINQRVVRSYYGTARKEKYRVGQKEVELIEITFKNRTFKNKDFGNYSIFREIP